MTELEQLTTEYFGLESKLAIRGEGWDGIANWSPRTEEGRQMSQRVNDIRTYVNDMLSSMGQDAPVDPIEKVYERRRKSSKISKESTPHQSSGDSAFERRCQEIAGQRYSASEICGGPDTAYEQAQREAKFVEDIRNMNY